METEKQCEHKWSAPAIAQVEYLNDFGTRRIKTKAVVSCEKCGEIKEKSL